MAGPSRNNSQNPNIQSEAASESLTTFNLMPTHTATSRTTVCPTEPLLFGDLGRRQVVADSSGGYLSSDGGALLLRQVDASLGLLHSHGHAAG